MTSGLVRKQPRPCLECGGGLQGRRGDFCSRRCNKAFQNRRMVRGAALYDLFMASRFELEDAKVLKVWREMNRLASTWREEDLIKRAGRKSYRLPRRVLNRLADDGRLRRGEVLVVNNAGKRGRR